MIELELMETFMALCKSLNKLDHKEQEKKIGSRPWSKASQRGKLLLVVSFAPLLEIILVKDFYLKD